MRALALVAVLACGRPTAPIGPDPAPVRPAPPPRASFTTQQIACVLAEYTCAARARETIPHGDIARRCSIDVDDVGAIEVVIHDWINELYSARCLLGALGGEVP